MDRRIAHFHPETETAIIPALYTRPSRGIIKDLRQRTLSRERLTSAIIQCIQDEMPNFPSLEQLANFFCISSRTLSRRLLDADINYRKLIAEFKLTNAREQLRDSTTPIDDIAKSLGYQNHSNFTKAFKKWCGETPHRYRLEQHRLARS